MMLLTKIVYMLMTNPGDTVVPFSDAQVVMNQTVLIDEEDKEVVPLQINNKLDYFRFWHSAQTNSKKVKKEVKERLK